MFNLAFFIIFPFESRPKMPYMRNLFDKEPYFEIVERLMKLTPESNPLWGKMNVAQMFAHCTEAFNIPLSNKKPNRSLMGPSPINTTCPLTKILSLKISVTLMLKNKT